MAINFSHHFYSSSLNAFQCLEARRILMSPPFQSVVVIVPIYFSRMFPAYICKSNFMSYGNQIFNRKYIFCLQKVVLHPQGMITLSTILCFKLIRTHKIGSFAHGARLLVESPVARTYKSMMDG